MRLAVLNVKFHDFQVMNTSKNVVLAKCNCCSPPRWGVFVANNGHKNFYYHGYDEAYARRLFHSLGQRSQREDEEQ